MVFPPARSASFLASVRSYEQLPTLCTNKINSLQPLLARDSKTASIQSSRFALLKMRFSRCKSSLANAIHPSHMHLAVSFGAVVQHNIGLRIVTPSFRILRFVSIGCFVSIDQERRLRLGIPSISPRLSIEPPQTRHAPLFYGELCRRTLSMTAYKVWSTDHCSGQMGRQQHVGAFSLK